MNRVKTVLIVDDNAAMRSHIYSMIRVSNPYAVIVQANHGNHAWEIINAPGKKFDVVISDVDMLPDMNGVQLTEKITEKHPDVHVILMSGHEEPENHKAHGFMKKPFQRADLLKEVKRLMDKI